MRWNRTWWVVASAATLLAASCASGTPASLKSDSLGDRDAAVSRELPQTTVLGSDVGGVTLRDASNYGEPFVMTAPDGGALIVYFGYTSCPDVCPTTMADLRTALADLGDTADHVTVAMATVDPDRDTDEVITDYVQFFVPSAHALRTEDADDLKAAADAFGVSYSVVRLVDGRVDVGHSPFMYAVDDSGEIRAVWMFGTEPDRMARDIAEIVSG